MSIQNLIGNGISGAYHMGAGTLQEVGSRIESLLSGATARIESLWDGGFVGIDTVNYTILTEAIDAHVKSLEDIINNFNTDAYIDGALRGQARDEAVLYVKAIKQLLEAYATTYRQFNIALTGAAHGESIEDSSIIAQMLAGDQSNAQAINYDAQAIQTEADSIRID